MAGKGGWDVTAPCGMYCGECKAYVDGECGGCRSGEGIARDFSKACAISLCSSERGKKVCLDCKDFPCPHHDYFKARRLQESAWYVYIVDNMKSLREVGLDQFCRRMDESVAKRRACAEEKGVHFCDTCKEWPCKLVKNPVLLSEPDVPP